MKFQVSTNRSRFQARGIVARCGFLLGLAVLGGCGAPANETTAPGDTTTNANVPDGAAPGATTSVSPLDAPLGAQGDPASVEHASPVTFVDVTRQAGIRLKQYTGAFGFKWLPEQLGSGVACFDFDSDGWPDIYFPNGRDWNSTEIDAHKKGTGKSHMAFINATLAHRPKPRRTPGALYRNNHNGTFSDVTKGSGLDVEMYGIGVAAGDYDNDGRPDLYVTGYNGNRLFRNLGRGRFRDVTDAAGVRDAGLNTLSTSAMWVDIDRDGKLDLFVCHYARWNPALDVFIVGKMGKGNASPEHYQIGACRLFRNRGGKFEDISVKAGISPASGDDSARAKLLGAKALGVALCDFDNDAWPDIAVANDREMNFLFRNNRNGTFTNVARKAGVAAGAMGQARSGMGIDVADIDHSNRESLVIGNFSGELLGLYRNLGNGLFVDIAPTGDVGMESKPFLTFGCLFSDVDNDGWPDIFLANGHVNDLIEKARSDRTYAQRPLVSQRRHAYQRLVSRDRFGKRRAFIQTHCRARFGLRRLRSRRRQRLHHHHNRQHAFGSAQ